MTNKPEVVAFPEFEKALKRLAKRFSRVRGEVADLVRQLEAFETPGDRIPHVTYEVYKVRLANPDAQKGKSGGFRVIYYLKTQTQILLVNIYSKSDQTDMQAVEIAAWIETYLRQAAFGDHPQASHIIEPPE